MSQLDWAFYWESTMSGKLLGLLDGWFKANGQQELFMGVYLKALFKKYRKVGLKFRLYSAIRKETFYDGMIL
jgi:hypothetical protein